MTPEEVLVFAGKGFGIGEDNVEIVEEVLIGAAVLLLPLTVKIVLLCTEPIPDVLLLYAPILLAKMNPLLGVRFPSLDCR